MESFVFHYLTWWRPVGYAIVFVGMILEGEAILFTASFLTRQGVFDLGDMMLAVLAGAIVGDLLWYWLGVYANGKTFFLSRWVKHFTEPFDSHITERPFHTIFLSKFVYGLNHAVIMRLGMRGMPLNQFIKINFVTILLWGGIIGGLGYASGASFSLLKHYVRFAEFTLLAALVFFFIFGYVLKRTLAKKL